MWMRVTRARAHRRRPIQRGRQPSPTLPPSAALNCSWLTEMTSRRSVCSGNTCAYRPELPMSRRHRRKTFLKTSISGPHKIKDNGALRKEETSCIYVVGSSELYSLLRNGQYIIETADTDLSPHIFEKSGALLTIMRCSHWTKKVGCSIGREETHDST